MGFAYDERNIISKVYIASLNILNFDKIHFKETNIYHPYNI